MRRTVGLLVLGLSVIACGSDEETSTPAGVSYAVPASGGTVALPKAGAGISFTFPASAAGANVTLTPSSPETLGLSAGDIEAVVRMEPDGMTFKDPVVLKPESGDFAAFSFPGSGAPKAAPEALPLTADGTGIEIRHFSTLVLVRISAAAFVTGSGTCATGTSPRSATTMLPQLCHSVTTSCCAASGTSTCRLGSTALKVGALRLAGQATLPSYCGSVADGGVVALDASAGSDAGDSSVSADAQASMDGPGSVSDAGARVDASVGATDAAPAVDVAVGIDSSVGTEAGGVTDGAVAGDAPQMPDATQAADGPPIGGGPVPCTGSICRVETGYTHTCALKAGGGVRCWGDSGEGRLGYGGGSTAADVAVGGPATQVVLGRNHTCALLSTGSVRCWGSGEFGQIGYGNTRAGCNTLGSFRCVSAATCCLGDGETPASVGTVDIGGTVIQLAAGYYHTCALLADGKVRCWGANDSGQLGYGHTTNIGDDESPASAGDVNVGGVAIQLAAGSAHTCAILSTGAVRCWGAGAFGQLGYANAEKIGDTELPASAGDVMVGGTVTQIAASGEHTCALLSTGVIRCWGRGQYGRLGYANEANIGDGETPASASDVDIGGPAVAVTAGDAHTCAILSGGALRCWGRTISGRLGVPGLSGSIGDNEKPVTIGTVDVGGAVSHVSAGGAHVCAALSTGVLRCWGLAGSGQLGYADTSNNIGDNETPASAGNVPVN